MLPPFLFQLYLFGQTADWLAAIIVAYCCLLLLWTTTRAKTITIDSNELVDYKEKWWLCRAVELES
jgi:hypothetical protein